MGKRSALVACSGCGASQKRLPTCWTWHYASCYCPSCWNAVECTGCRHHDPLGAYQKGKWLCRSCDHKSKFQSKENKQDTFQNIIIDDHKATFECSLAAERASFAASASTDIGLSTPESREIEEAADSDAEDGDFLAPLPAMSRHGKRGELQEGTSSHVVIMIDASGSMRAEDVQAPAGGTASATRFGVAAQGARDFIQLHAKEHPQDVFSVVFFEEEATVECEAAHAERAADAVCQSAVVARNGTFFKPAFEAAARCLALTPDRAKHVAVLTDGRPADTKDALGYFQDMFVTGNFKGCWVHGIGVGAQVESFAVLQQLVCLSGGSFALSNWSLKGLCEAFASVSTSICAPTLSASSSCSWEAISSQFAAVEQDVPLAPKRCLRALDFEVPEMGQFGKRNVDYFEASRAKFVYSGQQQFEREACDAAAVARRRRPYMRGGMRLVYGFRDAAVVGVDGGWMVAKLSRFSDEVLNSRVVVEAHAKSTAVAQYFSVAFNAAIAQLQRKALSLIFVPCFVYERPACADSVPADEPRFFGAERYLPGLFLKYNSNSGFVNGAPIQHSDEVQAFLHFTYERSGGEFLVADLQGVARKQEVLLTDPQVLSASGKQGAYGPGDIGAAGVHACLASHRCGPTCKALGLSPVSPGVLRRLRGQIKSRADASSASASSFEHVPKGNALFDMAGSEGSAVSSSSWCHLLES